MVKFCNKCDKDLDISCFSKKSSSKDGLRTHCKECCKEYSKKYVLEHPEWKKAYGDKYRREHPEQYKAYQATFRKRHRDTLNERQRALQKTDEYKEKKRAYYIKSKDRIAAHRQKPEVREKIREREKRWRNNPTRKISGAISRYLRYCLNGNKAGRKWESLVGFTLEELKRHLESKFRPGMTWINYGEWEIDHIHPISAFKFNDESGEEFKRCWSLDNLQPLWKSENRHKRASIGWSINAG